MADDNIQLLTINDYGKPKTWQYGQPITPDDLNRIEDQIDTLTLHTQEVETNIENIILVSTIKPNPKQAGHYFNQIWIDPNGLQVHTIPTLLTLLGTTILLTATTTFKREYINCSKNPFVATSSSSQWRYWIIPCKLGETYEIKGAGSTYQKGYEKIIPRYCLCYASPNQLVTEVTEDNKTRQVINNVTNIKYATTNYQDNGRLLEAEIITITSEHNLLIVHEREPGLGETQGYVRKRIKGMSQLIEEAEEKINDIEANLSQFDTKVILSGQAKWELIDSDDDDNDDGDDDNLVYLYTNLSLVPETRYNINIKNSSVPHNIKIYGVTEDNIVSSVPLCVIPAASQNSAYSTHENFYTLDYSQVRIEKIKTSIVTVTQLDSLHERNLRALYNKSYDMFTIGRLHLRTDAYGRLPGSSTYPLGINTKTFIHTAGSNTAYSYASPNAEYVRAENLKIALLLYDDSNTSIGFWDGEKMIKVTTTSGTAKDDSKNQAQEQPDYMDTINILSWFSEIDIGKIKKLYKKEYPHFPYKIIAYKPGFETDDAAHYGGINLERDSRLIHFYTEKEKFSSIGLYRKWAYIGASSDSGYYNASGSIKLHRVHSWPNILSRMMGNEVLNYSYQGRYVIEFLNDKTSGGNNDNKYGMSSVLKELKRSFEEGSASDFNPCEVYFIGLGGNDATVSHNSTVYPVQTNSQGKLLPYPYYIDSEKTILDTNSNANYAWHPQINTDNVMGDILQLFEFDSQTNSYKLKTTWSGYTFNDYATGETSAQSHTTSLTEYPNTVFGQYWATLVTLQSYINYFYNKYKSNMPELFSTRPKIVLVNTIQYNPSTRHQLMTKFIRFLGEQYKIPVLDWYDDSFSLSRYLLGTREDNHPIKPALAGKALAFDRLFSKLVENNYEYFLDRKLVNVNATNEENAAGNFTITNDNDPYKILSLTLPKEEEINDAYRLKYITLTDITKYGYKEYYRLNTDNDSKYYGRPEIDTSKPYIMFGYEEIETATETEPIITKRATLYLKAGSSIEINDNVNYGFQAVLFDTNDLNDNNDNNDDSLKKHVIQFKGLSQGNSFITSYDGYVVFCFKSSTGTIDTTKDNYQEQIKINFITDQTISETVKNIEKSIYNILTITDIAELNRTSGVQISSGNGRLTENQAYIVFCRAPLHVKAGSQITLNDNTTYALQMAKYNPDGTYILNSYVGIGNESSKRTIPITEDCYIRFGIRLRANKQGSVTNGLNQLEINLKRIIDGPFQSQQENLPYESNTYILTATVDSKGNISYNWVPQQS